MKKYSLEKFFLNGRMEVNKNPALEPCVNITAVSLTLKELVKEQSLIFCVCYFERSLNIHPPFVVSVSVLIINIHRLRAMKSLKCHPN